MMLSKLANKNITLRDYAAYRLRQSKKGYKVIIALTITYAATQFNFKFKLPSTKSITLYWGDGTSETVVGQDDVLITKTSSYSSAGTYSFYITGDALDLTYIDISAQAFVSGDVSSWSALTNLTYLSCYSTSVSGDVSGWSALTNLTYLRCNSTSVSGDVSSWSALTSLTYLSCYSTSVSGDVSGWGVLTGADIYCYSTSVDFDTTAAWVFVGKTLTLDSNGWTSTQVDNCLAALAATPVTGCTINIAGTNAARTSASDAHKATILANGNTLTVNE